MTRTGPSLDLPSLAEGYASGALTPTGVAEAVLDRIAARGRAIDDGVFITVAARARVLEAAREVERRRAAGEALPLYGVPFAVKDNIDVAGTPTTAACPAFAHTPAADAAVVARLGAAGAIVVGKTNLDQFATGLVGVRSPYGIPRNPFDERYIAGGSSSGSAVAVAAGLVSFALGTDTAGSGRVPAAFNNIVGLKPSRGLLSTTGLVPACRSLDCVSVFALTVADAARVADLARGFDAADPYSRPEADTLRFAPLPAPPRFHFAVPAARDLEFCGDERARTAFARAVAYMEGIGGAATEIDFAPFREAAGLLYGGPFVAERLEAAGRLLAESPDALVAPLRAILADAPRWDARSVFAARARLRLLARRAGAALAAVDCLLVPTAPTIYRIAEIEAEPLALNATLGIYASFVNLLDLAAGVPAGFRDDGLPAGVTLVGPRDADARLGGIAARLHAATSARMGATSWPLPPPQENAGGAALESGFIPMAVVGAHLAGEPLNPQLTDLGARFVRAAKTAPHYRLYALPNTTPPKPGLVRAIANDPQSGSITVEVWALPAAAFGTFVSRVPPPLCIGSVELDDGTRVSGFLCEAHALTGAQDITTFGGWRAFLRAR
jgi:allophanate hydrolase